MRLEKSKPIGNFGTQSRGLTHQLWC